MLFNNSNGLFFMISCRELTRSVLITTVKVACREIIYFVSHILPLQITLEITRSILGKITIKKWLLKNFFDLYRTELLYLNIFTSEPPNSNQWSDLLHISEYRIKFNYSQLLLDNIFFIKNVICFHDNDVSPTGDTLTVLHLLPMHLLRTEVNAYFLCIYFSHLLPTGDTLTFTSTLTVSHLLPS